MSHPFYVFERIPARLAIINHAATCRTKGTVYPNVSGSAEGTGWLCGFCLTLLADRGHGKTELLQRFPAGCTDAIDGPGGMKTKMDFDGSPLCNLSNSLLDFGFDDGQGRATHEGRQQINLDGRSGN